MLEKLSRNNTFVPLVLSVASFVPAVVMAKNIADAGDKFLGESIALLDGVLIGLSLIAFAIGTINDSDKRRS